jgi:hypothetical protein
MSRSEPGPRNLAEAIGRLCTMEVRPLDEKIEHWRRTIKPLSDERRAEEVERDRQRWAGRVQAKPKAVRDEPAAFDAHRSRDGQRARLFELENEHSAALRRHAARLEQRERNFAGRSWQNRPPQLVEPQPSRELVELRKLVGAGPTMTAPVPTAYERRTHVDQTTREGRLAAAYEALPSHVRAAIRSPRHLGLVVDMFGAHARDYSAAAEKFLGSLEKGGQF